MECKKQSDVEYNLEGGCYFFEQIIIKNSVGCTEKHKPPVAEKVTGSLQNHFIIPPKINYFTPCLLFQ